MRLRGYSEDVPKPMVTIGARPVLWHVMTVLRSFWAQGCLFCAWDIRAQRNQELLS